MIFVAIALMFQPDLSLSWHALFWLTLDLRWQDIEKGWAGTSCPRNGLKAFAGCGLLRTDGPRGPPAGNALK